MKLPFFKSPADKLREEWLVIERLYDQLRATGESAPAVILSFMDTGVRVGDQASMLKFDLEVHPTNRDPFRAATQQSILDTSRPNFMPGSPVYVKYNPDDLSQVAIDYAPREAPAVTMVSCASCGATQRYDAANPVCNHCGKPLQAP